MKIEFLGIPYSGKTFIKNEIAIELKKNKINTISYKKFFYKEAQINLQLSFLDKIIMKIMFLKTNDDKQRQVTKLKIKKKNYIYLRKIFQKKVQNIKEYTYSQFEKKNHNFSILLKKFFLKNKKNNNTLKRWIIDTCVSQHIYEKRKNNNVTILDCEGFIHRLNSLMISSKNKNLPESYLKYVPMPHVLIYINEKPKTCRQRMKKLNNKEDLIKFDNKLEIFHKNTKLIYQKIKKKCPKIFIIDSKNYDSKTKKDIVKYILNKQKNFK